jgi:hypothetical protein
VALACIGSSLLIMIVVSAAGPSKAVVSLPRPGLGPPWWIPLHPAAWLVTVALWVAALAGAGGVAAGLVAARRGWRPAVKTPVVAALAATAVLAVLPPAGSTDTLDYAAYGRMVAIGHDPYVMTPEQLRLSGDPVGAAAPIPWETKHSLYGPLATIEQGTAAILGGTSAARITFWLKVWNALAFALVVLALDRLHLLWSLNPLLLWGLVAAGHVDTVAAAVGFLALALVSPSLAGRGEAGGKPSVPAGLAAGALVGMAADIKITFVLFGLGIALAARRSVRTVLAAGAGALAVLVPSYLWFGPPAVAVLFYRDAGATSDNFYQLFSRPFGLARPPDLLPVAVLVLVAVGWLLLRRLPDGAPEWPAIRPALALSLAWPLVWPFPAALVRRDGALPARPVPGVPARLAGPGPARRGHLLLHAGHARTAARGVLRVPVRRAAPAGAADQARGPAGRHGAVPDRRLAAPAAGGTARTAGAPPAQCANPGRSGSGASGVCARGCSASAREWRRRSARNTSARSRLKPLRTTIRITAVPVRFSGRV